MKKIFLLISKTFFVTVLLMHTDGYAQTRFPCNSTMYVSNGTKLYGYEPSGTLTELFDVGNINSLAFSTTGLLWAFDQTANSVVIIGSDGIKTPISIPGLPTSPDYNVGAIDANGYYYLYDGEATARFYIIDTDPARATYGQLVDPTATSGVLPYVIDSRSTKGTVIQPSSGGGVNRRIFSDWSINPLDGKLYTVTNSGSNRPYRLVSYDPVTGDIISESGQISGDGFQTNVSYGGLFLDLSGHIYVFGNTAGHLYSINTSTSTATRISTVSHSTSNVDGANCILSPFSLPVKLISFDAYQNDRVQLKWATASEEGSKGFEIERSGDNTTWVNIGFVSSLAREGNSTKRLDYSFTDISPLNGVNYYRLKQIDFDGNLEYSPVKSVSNIIKNSVTVFPNPTNNYINISGLKGNEMILIIDMNGRILKSVKSTNSLVNIPVQSLSEGVYKINVIGQEGAVLSKTFVKIK